MCWRAVIGSVWLTTSSRENVKDRSFPWQHLRKPQSTAAAEQTDQKTRLRSSVEIQRKLDSQFQQIFHAKVRALIRKALDPETWGGGIRIFTLVNLELPGSQNLLCVHKWPTLLEDSKSTLFEDHGGASLRLEPYKIMLILLRIYPHLPSYQPDQ